MLPKKTTDESADVAHSGTRPMRGSRASRDSSASWAGPAPLAIYGRASVAQFSREYVYDLSALASRADRTFRKACRRAETALAERSLHVEVLAGGAVTEQALERCAACRLRGMERRAADARAAAKRAGRKYEGPPYAGATKRGFLDAAASLSADADLALFVLSEPPACTATGIPR